MGLLQGPRLMAQTTKSPIRRNHWVPLGIRGHLGSVKTKTAGFCFDTGYPLSEAFILASPKKVSTETYF